MMFRVTTTFVLGLLCAANIGFAADLPSTFAKAPSVHHKNTTIRVKKPAPKSKQVGLLPIVKKLYAEKKPVPTVEAAVPTNPSSKSRLSWVLGPMVANADGGKHEGSASASANIVVESPGTTVGPEMIVELQGHVVKTIQSTVRLDIYIGDVKRSVTWSSDEVKSGIFKVTLNEKMPAGVLPSLIPVSALGFVTQAGEGHVAMVSLEKIVLNFTAPQVVSQK
jgi:hypothetical protein